MEKVIERGVYKLCYCGTEFYEYPYLKGKKKYCSTNCSNKANALKQSETKKRLKIGKGRQAWNKGKNKEQQLIYINLINKKEANKKERIPWNKGKHLSKKHRKSIGKARKGLAFSDECLLKMHLKRKGQRLGDKHPCWLGGVSKEPYAFDFNVTLKEKIKKRDKDTCQICLKKGDRIHHIDYNKLNSLERNLVTLCASCHSKTNYNRESWFKYFNNLISKKYD